MMEPEYISPEQISSGHDRQQTEEAKEEDLWTTDNTNGSMRYFLDDQHGWKLSVVDAAAGSRFYDLSRTEDGGATWETVNGDPFAGNIGVAEGLQFLMRTLASQVCPERPSPLADIHDYRRRQYIYRNHTPRWIRRQSCRNMQRNTGIHWKIMLISVCR